MSGRVKERNVPNDIPFFPMELAMSSSHYDIPPSAEDTPLRLLCLLLLLTLVTAAPLIAAEPSPAPDEMARLARKWTSEDDDLKSFEITGQVVSTFKFHVIRLPTGETASYLSSSHDGTPIGAIVQGNAVIWDALRRQIILLTDTAPTFEMTADAASTSIGSNAFFRRELDSKDWSLMLDLPAVLNYAPNDRRIEKLGDGHYRLVATTKKGGVLTTWLNQKRPQLVERFQANTKDGALAWEVTRLRINEKLTVRLPALPSKEQLAGRFEVIEMDGTKAGTDQQDAVGQRVKRSLIVRLALDETRPVSDRSRFRDMIEKAQGPVDWKALTKTDATDAKLIRELVRLPESSRQTNEPEPSKPDAR